MRTKSSSQTCTLKTLSPAKNKKKLVRNKKDDDIHSDKNCNSEKFC